MRKRNINWGFAPVKPTRSDLRKSRREFKGAVSQKVKAIRAEYSRLRKSARAGRTNDTRKLEKLFHEVYARNPRALPEMTTEQLAAIEKLIRGKSMASKKRKSKKKKNSRKGKMPAGLKAYWAKKRRAKANRRNPRQRRTRTRRKKNVPKQLRKSIRKRAIAGTLYGRSRWSTAARKAFLAGKMAERRQKRRTRRKSNPRRGKTTLRIKAPAGLGPKGLRKFRALAAKAYGVPARIVKR